MSAPDDRSRAEPSPALAEPSPPAVKEEPVCERGEFLYGLASLHAYDGEFDLAKVPEVSDVGLAAIEKALHSELEFTKLREGLDRVREHRLLAEIRQRRGKYFRELMELGYWLRRSEPDDVQVFPFHPGSLLVVGSRYQVRFLGDFCSSEIVEIRNTEGKYARPRWPKRGQIGFDCKHDHSVFEVPPDPALIRKALKERAEETPAARFEHIIFPNSAQPRVKETRWTKDGCEVVYLGAVVDPDTCNGRKLELVEGEEVCCTYEACKERDEEAKYFFLRFLDALSLRDAASMKKHVVPGGKILFTGNVFDEPLEFSARTTGVALKRFFDQAPGWAGLDSFGCVERDEGHTECRFGGGGTHFIVTLVPSPSRTRWYVAEVFGDEH